MYTDYGINIRKACVDMWLYMNTNKPFSGPTYDEKFVRGVLVEFFGFDKLANLNMEKTKLQFIRDMFAVRVLNDSERLSYFEGYVEKKCDECSKKQQSNTDFYHRFGN